MINKCYLYVLTFHRKIEVTKMVIRSSKSRDDRQWQTMQWPKKIKKTNNCRQSITQKTDIVQHKQSTTQKTDITQHKQSTTQKTDIAQHKQSTTQKTDTTQHKQSTTQETDITQHKQSTTQKTDTTQHKQSTYTKAQTLLKLVVNSRTSIVSSSCFR